VLVTVSVAANPDGTAKEAMNIDIARLKYVCLFIIGHLCSDFI
jgi:hypothetical protein